MCKNNNVYFKGVLILTSMLHKGSDLGTSARMLDICMWILEPLRHIVTCDFYGE